MNRDKVEELKQVLKNKKEHSNGSDIPIQDSLPENPPAEAAQAVSPSDGEFQEKLKQAEAKAQEQSEKYLRLYADFENYKKRAQKEKEELSRYAQEKVIQEFLTVLDDFERTVDHAEKATEVKIIIEGIQLIEKQMIAQFEKLGLKALQTLGQPFDPHFHEAMGQQASAEYPENTVVAEYRKGYTINGKLLRPALVAVSKGE